LYQDMGEYAKAEPLYQEALRIRQKVLGSEHPDTAESLNALATLYQDIHETAAGRSAASNLPRRSRNNNSTSKALTGQATTAPGNLDRGPGPLEIYKASRQTNTST